MVRLPFPCKLADGVKFAGLPVLARFAVADPDDSAPYTGKPHCEQIDIPMPTHESPDESSTGSSTRTQEPRLWRDDGWTARVIKNEDDDGWAVAMYRDSEAEPALVGPWTMGRDKKNPKPLDRTAFSTLVKTASEFVRRHEQQLHATLHQSVSVTNGSARITVTLDIVPDEDSPYALLSAHDDEGQQLAQVRVAPGFKLNRESAAKWADTDFRKPGQ
jgi:hypothetical protein